jgi:EAL domain-containing protein (putative c-di-GMP-specific phosphodiesterase class I)
MHQLSAMLRTQLEKNDLVERVGRDQIGIIIRVCDKSNMAAYAKEFHRLIQDYGTMSPVGALHVTCSIGSVNFPSSTEEATDAFDKAYIALNSTYGISYRTFEETRDEGVLCRQQMGLANYLRRAIQENRLRLAFQPVIDAASGRISHYEALLRIIGEDGKISSAGALIPVAERMGLIDMIDHIVFDMVMKELIASPAVTLAFNVSNITTDNPHWLEHATSVLKKYPDVASRTIVEITETAAQRDLRRTAYFVASLQAQGCQVALDDFGSGYTSFRQLKALSVDMVKIDGAFVKDLVDNADNRFFVKTLLDFTRGFGLAAVAEYVEKGETAKLLMELGVNYMQGYYFGKPENFRSWLNKGEYRKG